MQYPNNLFAQSYDSCSYGGSSYQNSSCGTTTTVAGGSSSASAGGSVLTDTGFDALVIGSLACAIIFVSLVVRFWRRPSSAQQGASISRVDPPQQRQAGGQQPQQ